jgi:hypothetical protein
MTRLLDIWLEQKSFFQTKTIEQLISIAGDGRLRDGNETSIQLQEVLSNLPGDRIEAYIDHCLSHAFQHSGLALQDLVNEVGRRLGFTVEPGYYRGGKSRIGFDGIWRADDGFAFIIEVKTTDAYQLNLDTIATYREKLIKEGRVGQNKSSNLIVVGRKDTGGLEAQTRGSRHAWDTRIVSVAALLKLMRIKENLSASSTVNQIQEILKPLEYTRVDRLVDVIFETSEDLQTELKTEHQEASVFAGSGNGPGKRNQSHPANYHQECVERISAFLKVPMIKQGRCTYSSAWLGPRKIVHCE